VWHSVGYKAENLEGHTLNHDEVLTGEHKNAVREHLNYVGSVLKDLGLRQSLRYIATIRDDRLKQGDITLEKLYDEASILQERIEHELDDVVTGFLPAGRVSYFRNSELFGSEVKVAFPSAAFDISEAGTCYTYGTYTACVFHLMRALEHPLRALAKKLGVAPPAKNPHTPLELRTWGDVIDKIIIAINARPNPKTRPQAELAQFYNKAADQFQFFKDAWRDVVMHTRSKPYGEGETKDLIVSVETFMRRLTSKLKE
jgi:hypothetical protein